MTEHNLTITHLPIKELAHLKGNPRKGDIEAVAESMAENGIYQPIIINKGTKTGRPNEIIAGNHRALAAKKLGHKTIPAIVLDLTETEATKIALADNRTSDLAEYDQDALLAMLESIEGDLEGTGYDDSYLEDLRDQLEELAEEPDWGEAFEGVEEKEQDNFYRSFTLTREQSEELDRALERAQPYLTGDEPGTKISAALAYIAMDFNER